jgi:tellurite resistance protein TerC
MIPSTVLEPLMFIDALGSDLLLWAVFNVVIATMLTIDLFVLNRKAHVISIKEAAAWSIVWIATAGAFNLLIFSFFGLDRALEFLVGYVVEKTLSVDNMFVFAVVFAYFDIPPLLQPRVLKWGIIGALAMRAAFIFAGAALLEAFHWTIFVFGGFLIITGARLLVQGERKVEPEKNPAVRLFRKLMPTTSSLHDEKFFVKSDGVRHATPLFIALIVLETTDLIFAIDSIPAIFAITDDVFIVYTSNIFAILGLRALYFLLAGFIHRFSALKVGLSIVLVFVGIKMLVSEFYKIPIVASLVVVFSILGISIAYSMTRQPTTPPTPLKRLTEEGSKQVLA